MVSCGLTRHAVRVRRFVIALGACLPLVLLSLVCSTTAHAEQDHVAKLIMALHEDASFKVRLQAAVFLGRSQDERCIRPLLATLDDPHYTVRGAASMALANLEYDPVIPRILKMAARDGEEFVREESRRALRKFDRDIVRPYLVAAFASDDTAVRIEIVRYLAELPDASSLQVLIRAIGDEPAIFQIARASIMAMGEKGAIELLEQVLSHKEPSVREGAIKILRDIGTRQSAELVRTVFERNVEEDSVRLVATRALRELRRHLSLDDLVTTARSSDERGKRVSAIKLLGVIGDERAFSTLVALLDDSDQFIRGRSVLALRDLGDSRAVESLQRMLDKPGNDMIAKMISNTVELLKRKEQPLR